ncbi:MAG TPA: helix-turn-helix domain-containing protein [Pseudonocardia sp.]|jgi:DNA-binding HxlR family transcriptional regulator|nr:helix-turn-helix domain-containing protein [Pseudonocardia sp.]
MVGQRRYHDGCAVAHGLDLVGERWALLVVRELLLGPKRFSDLRAGLPSASADVLTTRLRELTDNGIVRRRRLPAPAASWVYELTEWGAALDQVIVGLARWSSGSAGMADRALEPISVDSATLALRAMFNPGRAGGTAETVGLRVEGQPFLVNVESGALTVERAQPDNADLVDADLVIETDAHTLRSLLVGATDLDITLGAGQVTLHGEPARARDFLALFGH